MKGGTQWIDSAATSDSAAASDSVATSDSAATSDSETKLVSLRFPWTTWYLGTCKRPTPWMWLRLWTWPLDSPPSWAPRRSGWTCGRV